MTKLFKISIILILIIQSIQVAAYGYSENNQSDLLIDSIRHEDNDIEVTDNFQLTKVKIIVSNSFPAHYIKNGISHPITSTYRDVLWPKERPDTLIIPEGIVNIGIYFTGSRFFRSRYPNLRCVIFPNSLQTIGSYAFNSNKISNLIIPPSVIDIQSNAFADCKIKNLDLGKVQFIGAQAFIDCENLKWVRIPRETRMIGREAFNSYFLDNHRLLFLQLSPMNINPVIDFANTFGSVEIPYLACTSEFLIPGIKATYQSDMPEVFENRAMIHLDGSPVPLFFSFKETEDKEAIWEEDIDLWVFADKENIDTIDSASRFNPVKFRIDTSSIPHDKLSRLHAFYNDKDITDSIVEDSFTIDYGKIFNSSDYRSGAKPIYNRLKLTFEQ